MKCICLNGKRAFALRWKVTAACTEFSPLDELTKEIEPRNAQSERARERERAIDRDRETNREREKERKKERERERRTETDRD